MAVLFETMGLASVRVMLAGIPESAGVLVFAVGLIVMAVLVRKMMARGDDAAKKKVSKKAEV